MGRLPVSLFVVAALGCCALALMGAVPQQDERPPQPVFPEYVSGTVAVESSPAPVGSQIVACIDDCETVYESQPQTVADGGAFEWLELDPKDDFFINRDVAFYLVNEFGRIKANESRPFVGVRGHYRMTLTFSSPLPAAPTPVPTPAPTPTPVPTSTPAPMPTAPPTATPVPTPTLAPTPTAVPVVPTATPPPTPTAILPQTGDSTLTRIPTLALMAGGAAVALGVVLLLAARRWPRES